MNPAKPTNQDTHAIQLMKASFFYADEMETEQTTHSRQPVGNHGDRVKPLFNPQVLPNTFESPVVNAKIQMGFPRPQMDTNNHSFTEDPSVQSTHRTVLPRPSWAQTNVVQLKTRSHTAPLAQPQSLIPKHALDHIVPTNKSWTTTRNRLFKDAGHFS